MRIPIAALIAALTCSCADYGSTSTPDAATDLQETESPFCSGPAKLKIDGQLHSPVMVTSDRLVMDCCDGLLVNFHLSDQEGFNIQVFARYFGLLSPGEHWFPNQEAMQDIFALSTADPQEHLPLAGTLRITGSDTADDPQRFTMCVHTTAESSLGLQLWVENLPQLPWEWWEAFAIHRLADEQISAREAASQPLDSLELYHTPLLDLGTLAWYEARTHTLVLGMWRTVEYLRNQLPEFGTGGLPFVVTVHGQPIYLGAFFSSFSSFSFDHPVIVIDPPGNADDRLTIEPSYPGGGPAPEPDPRADPRLFELLSRAGKLLR